MHSIQQSMNPLHYQHSHSCLTTSNVSECNIILRRRRSRRAERKRERERERERERGREGGREREKERERERERENTKLSICTGYMESTMQVYIYRCTV